jgi:Tfp pilus assembly protein PilX
MRAPATARVRGVSLVEALVALAVMAFGILGVVGVQASLRATADLSKQRAEAVRIAQAALEDARAYSLMETPDPPDGSRSYAELATRAESDVVGPATNTVFRLAVQAADHFTTPEAPRSKSVEVRVAWEDRGGATQVVALRTEVAGVPPELAGALGVPGETNPGERSRGGRHPAIPRAAVDLDNGKSSFNPPGAGTLSWTFDNVSGDIVSICSTPEACTDGRALLLSGFVRFAVADPPVQPTGADAETPPSPAFPVSVVVNRTLPSIATIACYQETSASAVAYYCAVPVPADPPRRWSGRSVLGGFPIASTLGSTSLTAYRVCRYTPVRNHTPPGGNPDHPLDYANVTVSMANQNFLVIRAGNGGTAFDCPDDDPTTPLVNGTTWRHQPNS